MENNIFTQKNEANQSNFAPKIGQVYWMEFDGVGCELTGRHAGVIFQNNKGNKHSPNIIALPMTTKIKRQDIPTQVFVSAEDGTGRDTMVLCSNPRTISKNLVGGYITTLPDHVMQRIAKGHLLASAAIAFLDMETITEVVAHAQLLNM